MQESQNIRLRARNATILLDLDNCDAGYSPIGWQRDRLPEPFRQKVSVIFDGVDTSLWKQRPQPNRRVGDREIPKDVKVVTYVARGLEPIRGFDIFMKFAKRLGEMRDDVVFVVVGRDKVYYGMDDRFLGDKSFKEWVLGRDEYDLSRFLFVDWMEQDELIDLFSLSDLHVYLTTPFVLSWSLINAMSCGATVLSSRLGPVPEVIQDGENGYLASFFDSDGQATIANRLLDDPEACRLAGEKARRTVEERMSVDVCLPRIRGLIEETYESVMSSEQHDYRLQPIPSGSRPKPLARAISEGRTLTDGRPGPFADLLGRPQPGKDWPRCP